MVRSVVLCILVEYSAVKSVVHYGEKGGAVYFSWIQCG